MNCGKIPVRLSVYGFCVGVESAGGWDHLVGKSLPKFCGCNARYTFNGHEDFSAIQTELHAHKSHFMSQLQNGEALPKRMLTTLPERPIDSKSVENFLKKYIRVTNDAIGEHVKFTISGNGNIVPVLDADGNNVMSQIPGEEGVLLEKKIYNLQAMSSLALSNSRNKAWAKEGAAAEVAGDKLKAHNYFAAFTNAVQMSFSVILNGKGAKLAKELRDGSRISAKVVRIDSENGSLITIDPSTITILEAKTLESADFSVSDFIGSEE